MRKSNRLDDSIHRRLRKLAVWLIAGIILIAILDLLGWQLDIDFFIRPIPDLAAMNPTSAVAFLLSAFSLLGMISRSPSRRIKWAALICALAVMAIGLSRLTGPQIAHSLNHFPNRMAGITAACFVLCSVSLLLLGAGKGKFRLHAQWPVLLTGAISLLSVIGYLYRVGEFYGVFRFVPMTIHTALCFLIFSLAFLLVTGDQGIMRDITGTRIGSVTARRLIPFALLAPICLGWLRLLGAWAGLFTVEFGVSILVLSIISCFLFIIWYNAALLNKRDVLQTKAVEALRESERRFTLLVGSIKDYAIYMLDTSGHIVSWNEGARAIKGYAADEVIGKPISIFYTAGDNAKFMPTHNLEMARLNGHYQSTGWRLRKDGSKFWADVAFTPLYDEEHRLQGFAKVTRDMTEKRMAEEKIAYQARLMEDSTDAIYSVDNGFRIVSWNKAAENLYGLSRQEAIGESTSDLRMDTDDPESRESRRKEVAEKGYWSGEVVHMHKNGSPLHLLLSISAIRDPEDRFQGYVLVCRDITERLRAEDLLRKFNEDLAGQVREKTEELASVFDRLSEGFMSIDKTGLITYVNRMASEMNKRAVGDLIGKNFWQLFPTALKNEFGQQFGYAMSRQENRHFEMFSPSLGLWIDCAMYPSAEGISCFFRDINEQRKARETINRSNVELRALASHLQNIREEERSGIAREIHDELGQQLTGLKMDISWIAKRVLAVGNDTISRRVVNTQQLLDHTIITVRKIATELRPSILDDLGLVAAIEWQAQEFEKRSGIMTSFQADPADMRFPPDISICLFRICQEALTNVARHSGAKRVGICLQSDDDHIHLRIIDNGKGLPLQNAGAAPKKTLGLVGMQERALAIGGNVEIESGEGNGLSLTVNIPLTLTNS
ncbi:MAG: PAS domain S-box protein [Bacteroidota bacterium]|nr:PAS domain S-box protein [Bacteroidota bacterium]